MKRRHVFLRFLLCVLFPALGSIQAVGNDNNYYAQVTATAIGPTGAGTVYAAGNAQNGTPGTTSIAIGRTDRAGRTASFTFTATPNENYDFMGWTSTNDENANPESNNNPYTKNYTTSSNQGGDNAREYNIYAIFKEKPLFYFSATANVSPAGAGTATATPATTSVRGERGSSTSATATTTFTATPNDGYVFDGWYSAASGGTLISRSNPYNATITSTSTNSGSPTNTTYYARFLSIANPTGITATDKTINVNITKIIFFIVGHLK